MNPFSIRESLAFGWQITKAHSRLLFSLMLTLFALQILSAIIQKTLEGTLLGAAASIIIGVVGVWIGAGFTLVILRLAKGESAAYADLYPPARPAWRYFLVNVVAGAYVLIPAAIGALVAGGIALAVGVSHFNFSEGVLVAPLGPGSIAALAAAGVAILAALVAVAYVLLRFSFARLAFWEASEEKHYIRHSLRRSSQMTSGIKWRLLGFFIILGLLNLLGAIVFLVGLLVTVPVTILAYVHVYLKLKHRIEAKA